MGVVAEKKRAPRNRTLTLSPTESTRLRRRLLTPADFANRAGTEPTGWRDRTVHGDTFALLPLMGDASVDLVFADPPYNLSKKFNTFTFQRQSDEEYEAWLAGWLPEIARILSPAGSLYLCGDWRSSPLIYAAAKRFFIPRNRITWEREKGRGAKANWKNCSEDIWFFTKSERYYFDVDAVKLQRRVLAPYVDGGGKPKDWRKTAKGNFRSTHPSNLWTDLTVPFWSMPENTDHPTQKPEKLLAKIVLSSTRPGQLVFDPFLGSGTTSVVAKKLGRSYLGCERDLRFCMLAEKRLELANTDSAIQGYVDGVFWERNSAP